MRAETAAGKAHRLYHSCLLVTEKHAIHYYPLLFYLLRSIREVCLSVSLNNYCRRPLAAGPTPYL